MINGYQTFNSVALSGSQIHFLGCTPIDTRDPNVLGEGETFHKKAAFAQIREVSDFFKQHHPEQIRLHLMDREIDDVAFFEFFEEELADKFVGRLKLNRNSVYKGWDAGKNKEVSVKLKDQIFANRFEYRYEKFVWKRKVFQNAKAVIHYDTMIWGKKSYGTVKVELFDREGRLIFSDPMLLVTNLHLAGDEVARQVYHHYLQRSRIEGVFKFLKTNLGWEDFRLRDFVAIRNIIALVFWVGAYFYERQEEFVLDEYVQFVCRLAKSKGKVTRHFFLEGLTVLAHYKIAQQHFNEQGWTTEQINAFVEKQLNIIASFSDD
jgi:hypothetical protein